MSERRSARSRPSRDPLRKRLSCAAATLYGDRVKTARREQVAELERDGRNEQRCDYRRQWSKLFHSHFELLPIDEYSFNLSRSISHNFD
jgi:hypothetical protein